MRKREREKERERERERERTTAITTVHLTIRPDSSFQHIIVPTIHTLVCLLSKSERSISFDLKIETK